MCYGGASIIDKSPLFHPAFQRAICGAGVHLDVVVRIHSCNKACPQCRPLASDHETLSKRHLVKKKKTMDPNSRFVCPSCHKSDTLSVLCPWKFDEGAEFELSCIICRQNVTRMCTFGVDEDLDWWVSRQTQCIHCVRCDECTGIVQQCAYCDEFLPTHNAARKARHYQVYHSWSAYMRQRARSFKQKAEQIAENATERCLQWYYGDSLQWIPARGHPRGGFWAIHLN